MSDFKPMLAGTVEDTASLKYPVYASPKLDGIRALVRGGVLMSRNLKPIPNKYLRAKFSGLAGLDGELIAGDPAHPECFRLTTSAVMSVEGEPEHVRFHAFDYWDSPAGRGFSHRLEAVRRSVRAHSDATPVPHRLVTAENGLLSTEAEWLYAGYEGVMVRDPDGVYKTGRSTIREGGLLKLKRFNETDAIVTAFEEQQHNGNEATKDALGQTKRTTHKVGKVGKGTLGALSVVGAPGEPYAGVTFSVGTGFDDALRAEIWENKAAWLGRRVKYRYFPTGGKDAPRFPTYLGWREDV